MFADVIIPLGVEGLFTYSVPEALTQTLAAGSLVVVPFAGNKRYTGLVYALHDRQPEGITIRSIDRIIEEGFALSEKYLRFLMWMSEYYMSPPGDVIRAALPIAMRLESYTVVSLSGMSPDFSGLEEEEREVLGIMQPGESLSVGAIERLLKGKNLLPVIRLLLEKGLITVKEQVDDLFRPRQQQIVRWKKTFGEEELNEILDRLKRAPVQYALLCRWITYSSENGVDSLSRKAFCRLIGDSPAALKALCERGVLETASLTVSRLEISEYQGGYAQPLSAPQAEAYSRIQALFREKESVLLYGVTSSGKTEIYIHLIREMLDRGKQVLYLLPEIALTVQIVRRLQKVFGDKIGIYHSGMSDKARAEMWKKQNGDHPYPVVLGVRSSVFLPFTDLGLVIIDEEHENSYKQKDPNPRYNGRDSAMVLASLYGAKTLLGSATPSFESYRNALDGKYGLVTLESRYGDVSLPRVLFADLKEARRKKLMKGNFAPLLYDEMKRVLEQGEQVILFQNRRGYSTYLRCDHCGEIPKCKRCDVNMTYYKYRRQLSCHYCGSFRPFPPLCESCGKGHYRECTPGTERIEEEVGEFFPAARVARMDLESMGNKTQFRNLIDKFEAGELDVLIGTQMVTKGLDFDRVKLVGVMDADILLGFPDFRSEERTYQLLTQVSGRSGRKGEQGKVVIQVADPENRLYRLVEKGNYPLFYSTLSGERQLFGYPPFCRLIRIELRHKEERQLRLAANALAVSLRESFGRRVCGPAVPEVSRIRGQNRLHILLKAETGLSLSKLKSLVKKSADRIAASEGNKGIRIWFDVDPV